MITFSKLIYLLLNYWKSKGAIIVEPIDSEIGAATFHPVTFFNSISDLNNNVFYVYNQLCRRPDDSKYGNYFTNKLQQYYQLQVILKPSISNMRNLYLNSLKILGIDFKKCDLKFIQDNWENPTLGAYGVGWEVLLNGVEVTQFTYFDKMANIKCLPSVVEITYGLERLSMFLQNIYSIYNLVWDYNYQGGVVKYIDVFNNCELDKSRYSLDESDVDFLNTTMIKFKKESIRLLKIDDPLILSSYDLALKVVYFFNLLEARKYFSNIERQNNILSIRNLFCKIASAYVR